MAERRPMGALEADVLDVLWRHDAALTPAEVRDALDDRLAYTTVMTVLTRLHTKGIVDRERVGRAFAYTAAVSEADLAATRMRSVLVDASDRVATLNRFVGTLTNREASALRDALEELDG